MYIIDTSFYMVLLLALDLAFIPEAESLTDHVLEKTQMKACHMQEKESTQLSERDKLILRIFNRAFLDS